ncbi:YceI-like domain-containing protein [Maribacter vaceletii]|uniref:YceI-like domain-containing protein n=1 Tax=Maribacter vaceletii TaxID=1206816 RepID=A0A495EDB0_9FLAO|nr:YceI family protein [Maribacter vaceletii]RKR14609.1 YceI-like domain-containing protein [Maribacter vaceletii]
MKNVLKTMLMLLLINFTCLSAQEKKPIDIVDSKISWLGSKSFDIVEHSGSIKFKRGELLFKNSLLVGGEFIVDMNSIIDSKYNSLLTNHLKGGDFFNTEKFPFAYLVITEVNYKSKSKISLKADLIIKGITNSIDFDIEEQPVSETDYRAVFSIDRTKWGIRYGSKSFFEILEDRVISDIIKLNVLLSLAKDKC